MKKCSDSKSRRFVVSTELFAALALVAVSCRSPTEIVLTIDTNVPCTDSAQWKGVAVYVGEPGESLEKKWPALVTTQCDASGHVGTLVVAPSGDKDASVGVRVVAGLTRAPEECEEAAYAGCIVARRALRYSPHDSLDLDVKLLSDCVSQGCDPDHTCFAGRCVNDDFLQPPEQNLPPPSELTVRCGDDGVRCAPTGDVCCLTVDVSAGRTQGQCLPPGQCPSTSIQLNCDDDSDCARLGNIAVDPPTCFLKYDPKIESNDYWGPVNISLSECRPFSTFAGNGGLALCQDRSDDGLARAGACAAQGCRSSRGAEWGVGPILLPGYFWCEIGPSDRSMTE